MMKMKVKEEEERERRRRRRRKGREERGRTAPPTATSMACALYHAAAHTHAHLHFTCMLRAHCTHTRCTHCTLHTHTHTIHTLKKKNTSTLLPSHHAPPLPPPSYLPPACSHLTLFLAFSVDLLYRFCALLILAFLNHHHHSGSWSLDQIMCWMEKREKKRKRRRRKEKENNPMLHALPSPFSSLASGVSCLGSFLLVVLEWMMPGLAGTLYCLAARTLLSFCLFAFCILVTT